MSGLKIVYEDESIIVFDKPQGIATAPGKIEDFCTVVFDDYPALKAVNGYKPQEGGLLNRLDNETGGLLLFAKSDESFGYYSMQMNEGKMEKIYIAMVDGVPPEDHGTIDVPVAHHHSDVRKMVCAAGGAKFRGKPRNAVTHWRKIMASGSNSFLEVKIKKGARHQIRVHLAFIGYPIRGDKLYNKLDTDKILHHCLYAKGINFVSFFNENIVLSVKVPFYE